MRKILFFRTFGGECPVEDFLDSLPSKHAQKIAWVMSLVEDLEKIPKQYFKKLIGTSDIWEIRAQLGSDILRILGFMEEDKFIATNGFKKNPRKHPHKKSGFLKSGKLNITHHLRGNNI